MQNFLKRIQNSIKGPLFLPTIANILKFVLVIVIMDTITITTTKKAWLNLEYELFTKIVDAQCESGSDIDSLCTFIIGIDRINNIYSAVYHSTPTVSPHLWELKTSRNPDITPGRTVYFKPFEYEILVDAILKDNSGHVVVPFEVVYDNGRSVIYKTPVYFRYVDDYLVMMAIPKIPDTLTLPSARNVIIASLLVIAVTVGGLLIRRRMKHGS